MRRDVETVHFPFRIRGYAMRFSRPLGALLAGSLIVAGMTACRDDGDPAGKGGSASPSGAGTPAAAGLRPRDVVVTADCMLGGSAAAIDIAGWDPRTWKRLTQITFDLPAPAIFSTVDARALTPMIDLCRQPGSEGVYDSDSMEWAVPRIRAMFDRDFTRMAVVLRGSGGDETHVGFIDRQGKLTDLTGGGDSLGFTPREENAAMAPDGSAVWFTFETSDGKHRIGSRPVNGAHTLTDQGPATDTNLPLVLVGQPFRGVQAEMVHLSPDGSRMTAWAHGVDENVFDVPATSTALTADTAKHPKSLDGCPEAVGWTGPQTVLCRMDQLGQFRTVGTDPGAAPGPVLVPANDKENEGEVISPDGKRFIFNSHRASDPTGGFMGFYVAGTTPGSAPQKLTVDALNAQTVFLEWR
ncbi:hypothetical protein [Actinoallomurus sp. CA-142502]|uniref:hypothetical protein n=1 Tax=Actinoallomurus sp. CA-142502 TaxID=3239885 RepID=UPI003D8BB9BD